MRHKFRMHYKLVYYYYYFFSTVCCPRRCTYTILEVFTIHILFTVLHSNFTVFMVYCHENKVWYWVLFVIPHPLERIETAILASYPSAAEALALVLIGSGIPLGEPTVMMVPLRSIHYVQ